MKSEVAIQQLRELKVQATSDDAVRQSSPAHHTWKLKCLAVLAASIGTESATFTNFRDLRYHVGVWSGAPGEAAPLQPRRVHQHRCEGYRWTPAPPPRVNLLRRAAEPHHADGDAPLHPADQRFSKKVENLTNPVSLARLD